MEVIVMYSIGLIVISFIIAVTKSKLKGKAGEVTINHFLKKLDSNEYIDRKSTRLNSSHRT